MARINVPQKQVRSAGSTGVKADIDINSSAFRSAANLGATIGQEVERVGQAKERVAIEGQRVVDGGIGANYTREKSVFGREIQTSMMSEDLIGNHEAQRKSFDAQVKEREVAINEQLKEASPEQRQRILDVWEDDKASMDAQFRANRQREAVAKSVAQFEGAIEEQVLNGNTEEATKLIEQMPITDAAKQDRKNQLNEEIRAIQESDIRVTIAEAQEIPSLDFARQAIENSDLGTIKNNSLKRVLATREKGIKSAAYSDAGRYYTLVKNSAHEVITGQIPDAQTLLNRGLQPSDVAVMSGIIQGVNGSSGIGSDEFAEIEKTIKEYAAGGWFVIEEHTTEDRDTINEALTDQKWSFDARLKLAAQASRAFNADIADGVIGTALGDFELDESQKLVAGRMQTQIFDKIRNKSGEFKESDLDRITFKQSLLDPFQASELFSVFSDQVFLNQFKGKTKEEADALYEEQVTPLFTEAIKKSIQSELEESVKALQPQTK